MGNPVDSREKWHDINSTQCLDLGKSHFASFFRSERRAVEFKPFQGRDYSSIAAIFSGQGVAFEGQFGQWFTTDSRMRDHFQQADAWSQARNLPKPSMYLTAPQRINPALKSKLKNLALFTMQVGLFEELNQLGLRFSRVASYSFGEYAAWVASGTLTFAEMMEIVYWREELSPEPFESGTMILVGAGPDKIKECLEGFEHYVTNLLLPNQTIIACATAQSDQVVKKLFEKRVTCQKLADLAHPYHSPLLNNTREKLAEKIREMNLEPAAPRLPHYSSTLQKWVNAENFDKDEFFNSLSEELVKPVSFIKLSDNLRSVGQQSLVEFGADSASSELLKKLNNDDNFAYLGLSDYFRVETTKRREFPEKLRQSKFTQLVSKVVARLTGYEIEDIAIEDRFQEDLGIDSLKKAEVVFEVLHAANIHIEEDLNTSRFQALGDLVEYLEVGPKPGAEGQAKVEKIHVPFSKYELEWVKQPTNLHLEQPLKEFKEIRVEIESVMKDGKAARSQLVEQVNALSGESVPILIRIDCPQEDKHTPLTTFLHLVQFWRDTFMEMSTQNLQIALVGSAGGITYSGLRAFFQGVMKEHRNFMFMPVTCHDERPSAVWLWDQLQRPRLAERRLEDNICYERTWTKKAVPNSAAQSFKPQKVAWLGGSGGVAFELLNRCPFRADMELHLIGRRPSTDMAVQDRVSMLELEFASVYYHQADGSDSSALTAVLDKISATGDLDLVVNAAGVDHSSALQAKTDNEIQEELQAKLLPTEAIQQWHQKHESTFVVHFSSIVGLFGNAGQTVYALANAALAGQTRAGGSKNNLVVHWPAWENVGMTARPSVRLSLMENGVPLLRPEEGAHLFWSEVCSRTSGETTYFNDAFLFDEMIRNVRFERIQEFMGQMSGPRRRSIEKFFRLSHDYYLLDHPVDGKYCLPAATAITMFEELSYLIYGEYRPIQNFEMLNILIVDQAGVPANLSVRAKEVASQYLLRSLIVNARCEFDDGEPKSAPETRLPFEAKPGSAPLDIHHFYATGALFHGPRMQMLHKAWKVDSECVRAQVDRSKLAPIYGIEFFDTMMLLVDGYFQLMIANNYMLRQARALPVMVKWLRYNAEVEFTQNMWIQVDTTGSGGKEESIGSGVIYNDKGEVLIEIQTAGALGVNSIVERSRNDAKGV